ncbi:hypothetical protein ABER61_06550 [Brevibacillus formosus]|uniref:Uncharacterized protein n=1 Tax=Brevibacillus formosus TaxID=54913 RepID=A0A837KQ02_9BACL|nr:hypothetical protein [Brevibacillus formosus]KLH99738.1 hypothetical protein AA984_06285 [Brevibacillus formosus]MED1959705.1 hypothetical protein [Brevibacillus formosus]PSJ95790.1 hypothetical protein C7R91_13840 [Brevibacillus formosus]GED56137.1 hypothetical protein BFO01nite_02690 [Brevibacillus formosus]
MKIQFLQKEIWLQNRKYIVLTPTFHAKDIFACEFDKDMFMIFGNQQSLQYLACVLLIGADHRDKIIYVTNMEKDLPIHLHRFSHTKKNNELVFLHHSLQLNTHQWKELRQKVHKQKGRIRSFEVNPRKFSDLDYKDYLMFHYKENKDKILMKRDYDTLFITGSKIVFEYASGLFEPLSRTGAGSFLRSFGHDHYHLDLFTRNNQALCVDYYDIALWNKHLKD